MRIKKQLGTACIALGCLCVLVAVGLLVQNAWAERTALLESSNALAALLELEGIASDSGTDGIGGTVSASGTNGTSGTDSTNGTGSTDNANSTNAANAAASSTTATIAGAVYCGVLEIDAISLALPIQAEFSYANLKIAPCLYTEAESDALVISAHNYAAHFGSLPQLAVGDIARYTTLDGTVYYYEVYQITTVDESDLDAVQGTADELILFTCNINNNTQRVVVRCTLMG